MTTGMIIGATAVSYFVFSAAADAMSPPTAEQARGFYGFLYRFVQRLAANANRYVAAKYPGLAEDLRAEVASGDTAEAHSSPISLNLNK